MKFGEKLLSARLAKNLSQLELAEIVEVTERTIYNYEQSVTLPRASILKRLAEALNVSEDSFTDDMQADNVRKIDIESFIAGAKSIYGDKGAREAQEVLTKASALFAGGDLDEVSKDVFIQSLMSVYMASKAEASKKFSPKRRKSRRATTQ